MSQAKNGDTVKVQYTGKFVDGTTFDTSVNKAPLQFSIGKGMVIPGFEKAVIGMSIGESKSIKIPASEAYGLYRKELVIEIKKDNIPENLNPAIDQQLELIGSNGQKFIGRVTNVSELTVTLDANHFLAGKDLFFDIQLVEIV
ncbi:MAG: peptidylprolyl isomerase [Caldisericota bacterium]|nr:peptidylprolyl isomerase [Caldisericota bacterium]